MRLHSVLQLGTVLTSPFSWPLLMSVQCTSTRKSDVFTAFLRLGRRCHRRTVGSARARAPSACSPGAAARRAARGQVVRHGVARGTVEERGSAAARTLSVTAGACARGGAFGGPDGPKFHGAARRRGLPEQPLCAWVTLGEKGVLRVVLLVLCVCVALPVVASCVDACVRSCPTVVAQGRWCASRLLPVA